MGGGGVILVMGVGCGGCMGLIMYVDISMVFVFISMVSEIDWIFIVDVFCCVIGCWLIVVI